MRLSSLLTAALSAATFLSATVAAEIEEIVEPEIQVTAAFPETNTFNHVVNGEKNMLTLTVDNKSDRNVTLLGVSGSLHHPDTHALIKNLTSSRFTVPLLEGVQIEIPYVFYSEFKTGDHRLNIWLEHSYQDHVYRVSAYDSIVTIVEPELSWLDWKMWSTYLVVTGILGGLCYFAYATFAPQPKKRSKRPAPPPTPSVNTATTTGAKTYDEEWIPEFHLRKPKQSKKKEDAVSGTSAEELSGTEASGTEGKKRKGRK